VPTRTDLKWAQLKVGILVAVAIVILLIVVFAISGSSGLFTHTIRLVSYVADAGGLRSGATVDLQGVLIGNVKSVRLDPNPPDPNKPVRIDLEVSPHHERWLRTDSKGELGTAGPLGDTLVHIHGGTLQAAPAKDGTVLNAELNAGINDLLVSTHTILQKVNDLLDRVGGVLDQIQNGKGSIGKLVYSDELYQRIDAITQDVQSLTTGIAAGRGTIGKLATSDELYPKINGTLDSVNRTLDKVEKGNGTAAKLINDPTLYNNLNQTVANLRAITGDLNAGGNGSLKLLFNDRGMADRIRDTTTRLDNLLIEVQSGQGTAAKFLKDPALYNNTTQLLVEMRSLVQAIKTNPKKYLTIHLRIF